MKKLITGFLCLCISLSVFAQGNVYPTNWWTGMKKNKIELLLRGANIGNAAITLNYPGVKVLNKGTFDNKNYAFLQV